MSNKLEPAVLTPQVVGARESEFPGHDLEGGELDLSALAAPPPEQNAYLVYLSSIAEGESRRAMAGCLDRMAGLWAVRLDAELPDPAGLYFPWGRLRFAHTAAIRELVTTQTSLKTGTPWSPAYRNKHLTALRRVLRNAWLLGQMSTDDYMRAREVHNVKGVRIVPGRIINADERQALAEACLADGSLLGLRDAALLAVMHSSGCRREELAQADRSDYDPGTRTLRVIGKGDKQRETYLTPSAAAVLGRWLSAAPPGEPLFPAADRWGHITTAHMTSDGVGKVVTRRALQAGVPDVSAHDFRRTFASELLDLGVDLATVQNLLGHASATTTAGYDRRQAAARRAAVDKLDLTA